MKFYTELPDMECIQGDTLDVIEVEVPNLSDYTSPSMQVQLTPVFDTENTMRKDCTAAENGFAVTIDSTDTAALSGAYYMDFIITAGGLQYKKLRGVLTVHPAGTGGGA